MVRNKCFVLMLITTVVGAYNTETFGDDREAFIEGCLKSKGATTAECECLYTETRGELPAEEAAFLIASMGGDTALIEKAATKLSPDKIMAVLSSSWVEVVDKCLAN